MKNFNGLVVNPTGKNNSIDIADKNEFERSQIIIDGNNNVVKIGKAKKYRALNIRVRGNDKVIIIGDSAHFINNLNIVSTGGDFVEFIVGKNFSCGGLSVQMQDGNEKCLIGDDCMFSWGIKLRTSDGHSVIDLETNQAINLPKDVVISDRVWVGEDVSFLKGAGAGRDCIVASNSVVTKRLSKSNCVLGGIPAKVVKENVKWDSMKPVLFNKKNDIENCKKNNSYAKDEVANLHNSDASKADLKSKDRLTKLKEGHIKYQSEINSQKAELAKLNRIKLKYIELKNSKVIKLLTFFKIVRD
ncbi:hypothetical protein [Thalassomonas sp. M1454]|uniref:hypothetical protein n=1 Tax=Thalassomonas sp. M1454 TaxID=2594477 RepID=UPI001180D3C5|nr:hypothetical protein [Thalassomonas sp. M1454]TRX57404.1 hypothetical protein FNN08_07880 [Thalassomonas sp. M1454]